jgi:hypothetical protein
MTRERERALFHANEFLAESTGSEDNVLGVYGGTFGTGGIADGRSYDFGEVVEQVVAGRVEEVAGDAFDAGAAGDTSKCWRGNALQVAVQVRLVAAVAFAFLVTLRSGLGAARCLLATTAHEVLLWQTCRQGRDGWCRCRCR